MSPGPCTAKDPVTPAVQAGLRSGDRIVAFNGTTITSYDQLQGLIRANEAGSAQLVVRRDGQTLTLRTSTTVNGLPARTHASQGEQRSLALALRLATHSVVTEVTGSTPILLLDDVFSELDPDRSTALLRHLPPGQSLLTTAGPLPEAVAPELVVRVRSGTIM